ncbi:hypothetical protein EAH76_15260 [Sphingomonas glacialis]|uniref:Uncharacterized protein n=1 Tax=Sphingomonas glacialis TaxID=658225 RepID=A0A502FRL4_9SPHN|nr:hypothetical protein EAH76_15260 [Sphingomonas glacialis]
MAQDPVPTAQLVTTVIMIDECLSALGLDRASSVEASARQELCALRTLDANSCSMLLETAEMCFGRHGMRV